MVTIVQKYGGTSVETPSHLLDVARRILEEKARGHRLIVVVSAMGQSTDELVALARRVSPSPPRREMDMLLTAGERISMALLAIALDSLGAPAISFTGSQSGIITDDRHSDARIVAIRPLRIEEELSRDRIVIVAGFQGVSHRKEVTTLGRGGSDTTAVALAIRFCSPWCEIYTDVHGVLTADPRIVPAARTIDRMDYEPAIILSHLGAGVLFRRSVILARKYGMPIRVRCSLASGPDTWIGKRPGEATAPPEAREKREASASPEAREKRAATAPPDKQQEVRMESKPQPVNGDFPAETERILSVALERACVAVEIAGTGPAANLLALIDEPPTSSPWTWIATASDGQQSFVRGVCPAPGPDEEALRARAGAIGASIRVQRGLSAASMVGEGILARANLMREAIECLESAGIRVIATHTGSLSLSFLVEEASAPRAAHLLHDRFVAPAGSGPA